MQAMVPDDGWQNKKEGIWQPRADTFPGGFGPTARALEADGTRLGLWLPFDGTNTNIKWGVGPRATRKWPPRPKGKLNYYHVNHYCIFDEKYNQEFRRRLKQFSDEGHIAYYKHDFNNLYCRAEGHGHLTTPRHDHEALLDAELDLARYERELNPDVYLNITSFVWYSPWWLQTADSIWMLAADTGYNKAWPQLSVREQDLSYIDHHLFSIYGNPATRPQVPIADLMTCGIVHGKKDDGQSDPQVTRPGIRRHGGDVLRARGPAPGALHFAR